MSRPPTPSLSLEYLRRLNIWLEDKIRRVEQKQSMTSKGYVFSFPETIPITADYTANVSDSFIPVNATSAAVTITLPAADQCQGKRITVKKTDVSANTVTVDGNGAETIDDATTQVITTQYDSICVMSDGSEWWIV